MYNKIPYPKKIVFPNLTSRFRIDKTFELIGGQNGEKSYFDDLSSFVGDRDKN